MYVATLESGNFALSVFDECLHDISHTLTACAPGMCLVYKNRMFAKHVVMRMRF